MDIEEIYEIYRTADFIHTRNFARVALQFPDELLKTSIKVVRLLRDKINSLRGTSDDVGSREVRLFLMADTTFGSCCVDEVGASHVDADCVIHYGHTCLSPNSTLDALFVFGKATIDVSDCAESLLNYGLSSQKPVLALFGLEYAHAIPQIRELMTASSTLLASKTNLEFHFADVMPSVVNPLNPDENSQGFSRPVGDLTASNDIAVGSRHAIGGLAWDIPTGQKMEDYLVLWIGSDNAAFVNVVMTFNSCEIVRYDAEENCLVTDLSQQRRVLKRRYYLVEKAKDANIVGILVGTLGVAGYLSTIHKMKDLITGAGKKVYTLVMGRPNPAKLANFPECDIFVYVSCAQTALLDSKEFYAPVITPFEAILAFNRGSQWTGAYFMGFQDLISSSSVEVRHRSEEARFSFVQGGYVEDIDLQENNEIENGETLALANAVEKSLHLRDQNPSSLTKGMIKSGADYYFATRTYHGLDMNLENSTPEPYLVGTTGKASGYEHEKSKLDNP